MGKNGTVASLSIRLSADLAEFQQGMKRAVKKFKRTSKQMKQVGSTLSKNLSLPFAAATAGMLVASNNVADYADKIDKSAVKTGLSRKALQQLSYVADQAGVEYSTLENSVGKLTKTMGDADSGSKRQADAFKKLGIDIYDADGKMRSMESIFPHVVGSLSEMTNETERNALAMELFGKSATSLVPHLAVVGREGIQQLMDKASDLGMVMGDGAIADLVSYKDNMSTLTQEFQACGREMTLGFIPILQDTIIPLMRENIIPLVKKWAKSFKDLSPSTKKVILVIGALVACLGPLLIVLGSIASLGGVISAAFSPVVGIVLAIIAAVGALILVGRGLYKTWEDITYFFSSMWISIKKIFYDGVAYVTDNIKKLLDSIGVDTADMFSGVDGSSATINAEFDKIDWDRVTDTGKNALGNVTQSFIDFKNDIQDFFTADPINIPVVIGNKTRSKLDTKNIGKPMKKGIPTGDLFNEKIDIKKLNDFYASMNTFSQDIQDINKQISDSFKSLAGSITSSLGNSIESLAAGQGGVKSMLNGMLISVLDWAKQLGEILIASAVASEAFKHLFSSPWMALAAGVALVTTASIAKGLMQKGPAAPKLAKGGLAYGPTMAMVGDNPSAGVDPEVISPLSKLKDMISPQSSMPSEVRLVASGGNLRGVLNFHNRKNNSIG
jgi:TP901 family phage tail tape measure protein